MILKIGKVYMNTVEVSSMFGPYETTRRNLTDNTHMVNSSGQELIGQLNIIYRNKSTDTINVSHVLDGIDLKTVDSRYSIAVMQEVVDFIFECMGDELGSDEFESEIKVFSGDSMPVTIEEERVVEVKPEFAFNNLVKSLPAQ